MRVDFAILNRRVLWVLLWCVLLHRPALLSFGAAVPGSEDGDAIRGLWSAWLMSYDATPIGTFACNWPDGANVLPLPTLSFLLLIPFTALVGAPYALSLFVFFHSLLTVCGGFVLGRTLEFSKDTSLAIGLLLSATPMLGETLNAGVYEYLTLGWTPLFFAALIRACRGDWRFGLLSAVLYAVLLIDCAYYGSAAALGALVIVVAHARSLRAVLALALAAVLVLGLVAAAFQMVSPALEKLTAGDFPSGGDFRVIMGGAELLALLPGFGLPPAPEGMPDPFVSAPPLPVWILFVAAALTTLRKSYWSTLLAFFFLGVAMHSPLLYWWSNTLLGELVQNLRRFAAPMTLMMLVTIGYGFETWRSRAGAEPRGRWVAAGVIVLMVWSAKDLLLRYPLLWTPETPEIARVINSDPEPGTVLVYPQERDGLRPTSHYYLRTNTSFSNPQVRLWFQTLIDRPVRHYTRLATMIPRESPQKWYLDDGSFAADIQGLHARGLRYVILDGSQLDEAALLNAQVVMQALGHSCQSYSEWGGLELCLLEGNGRMR